MGLAPGEQDAPAGISNVRPCRCKHLGETFDIHGGGMDLIFPHHENEIAQSCGATGKEFAHYWIHNGFVQINQEKMSKSLGNFFTIREIFAKNQQWPEMKSPERCFAIFCSRHIIVVRWTFPIKSLEEAKNGSGRFLRSCSSDWKSTRTDHGRRAFRMIIERVQMHFGRRWTMT